MWFKKLLPTGESQSENKDRASGPVAGLGPLQDTEYSPKPQASSSAQNESRLGGAVSSPSSNAGLDEEEREGVRPLTKKKSFRQLNPHHNLARVTGKSATSPTTASPPLLREEDVFHSHSPSSSSRRNDIRISSSNHHPHSSSGVNNASSSSSSSNALDLNYRHYAEHEESSVRGNGRSGHAVEERDRSRHTKTTHHHQQHHSRHHHHQHHQHQHHSHRKNSSSHQMVASGFENAHLFLSSTATLPSSHSVFTSSFAGGVNNNSIYNTSFGFPSTIYPHAPVPASTGMTSAEELLQKFELVVHLGRGTFADVTLARHKQSKQLVALKRIPKQKLAQANLIDQTFTERRLLITLRHPFLVRLFKAAQSGTHLYFMLQFGQGGDFYSFQSSKPWIRDVEYLLQRLQYPYYTPLNKDELQELAEQAEEEVAEAALAKRKEIEDDQGYTLDVLLGRNREESLEAPTITKSWRSFFSPNGSIAIMNQAWWSVWYFYMLQRTQMSKEESNRMVVSFPDLLRRFCSQREKRSHGKAIAKQDEEKAETSNEPIEQGEERKSSAVEDIAVDASRVVTSVDSLRGEVSKKRFLSRPSVRWDVALQALERRMTFFSEKLQQEVSRIEKEEENRLVSGRVGRGGDDEHDAQVGGLFSPDEEEEEEEWNEGDLFADAMVVDYSDEDEYLHSDAADVEMEPLLPQKIDIIPAFLSHHCPSFTSNTNESTVSGTNRKKKVGEKRWEKKIQHLQEYLSSPAMGTFFSSTMVVSRPRSTTPSRADLSREERRKERRKQKKQKQKQLRRLKRRAPFRQRQMDDTLVEACRVSGGGGAGEESPENDNESFSTSVSFLPRLRAVEADQECHRLPLLSLVYRTNPSHSLPAPLSRSNSECLHSRVMGAAVKDAVASVLATSPNPLVAKDDRRASKSHLVSSQTDTNVPLTPTPAPNSSRTINSYSPRTHAALFQYNEKIYQLQQELSEVPSCCSIVPPSDHAELETEIIENGGETGRSRVSSSPLLPSRGYQFAPDHSPRVPLRLLAFYAVELALVLEYIHEHQYIYRDLKPENILMQADGHVLLTDFGVAKDSKKGSGGSGETSQPSRANTFTGTKNYMSPEVLLGVDAVLDEEEGPSALGKGENEEPPNEPVTCDASDKEKRPASTEYLLDWWSYGCVLFEWCNGHRAFDAQNEYWMFKNIVEDNLKINPEEDFKITQMELHGRVAQLRYRFEDQRDCVLQMQKESCSGGEGGESIALNPSGTGTGFSSSLPSRCMIIPSEEDGDEDTQMSDSHAPRQESAITGKNSHHSGCEPTSSHALNSAEVTPRVTVAQDFGVSIDRSHWTPEERDVFLSTAMIEMLDAMVHLRDLVVSLLRRDPKKRLFGGKKVLEHRFFQCPYIVSQLYYCTFLQRRREELRSGKFTMGKAFSVEEYTSALSTPQNLQQSFSSIPLSREQKTKNEKELGIPSPTSSCVNPIRPETPHPPQQGSPADLTSSFTNFTPNKAHDLLKDSHTEMPTLQRNPNSEPFWQLQPALVRCATDFMDIMHATLHRPNNWRSLFTEKQIAPTYAPLIRSPDDLRYFPEATHPDGTNAAKMQKRYFKKMLKQKKKERRIQEVKNDLIRQLLVQRSMHPSSSFRVQSRVRDSSSRMFSSTRTSSVAAVGLLSAKTQENDTESPLDPAPSSPPFRCSNVWDRAVKYEVHTEDRDEGSERPTTVVDCPQKPKQAFLMASSDPACPIGSSPSQSNEEEQASQSMVMKADSAYKESPSASPTVTPPRGHDSESTMASKEGTSSPLPIPTPITQNDNNNAHGVSECELPLVSNASASSLLIDRQKTSNLWLKGESALSSERRTLDTLSGRSTSGLHDTQSCPTGLPSATTTALTTAANSTNISPRLRRAIVIHPEDENSGRARREGRAAGGSAASSSNSVATSGSAHQKHKVGSTATPTATSCSSSGAFSQRDDLCRQNESTANNPAAPLPSIPSSNILDRWPPPLAQSTPFRKTRKNGSKLSGRWMRVHRLLDSHAVVEVTLPSAPLQRNEKVKSQVTDIIVSSDPRREDSAEIPHDQPIKKCESTDVGSSSQQSFSPTRATPPHDDVELSEQQQLHSLVSPGSGTAGSGSFTRQQALFLSADAGMSFSGDAGPTPCSEVQVVANGYFAGTSSLDHTDIISDCSLSSSSLSLSSSSETNSSAFSDSDYSTCSSSTLTEELQCRIDGRILPPATHTDEDTSSLTVPIPLQQSFPSLSKGSSATYQCSVEHYRTQSAGASSSKTLPAKAFPIAGVGGQPSGVFFTASSQREALRSSQDGRQSAAALMSTAAHLLQDISIVSSGRSNDGGAGREDEHDAGEGEKDRTQSEKGSYEFVASEIEAEKVTPRTCEGGGAEPEEADSNSAAETKGGNVEPSSRSGGGVPPPENERTETSMEKEGIIDADNVTAMHEDKDNVTRCYESPWMSPTQSPGPHVDRDGFLMSPTEGNAGTADAEPSETRRQASGREARVATQAEIAESPRPHVVHANSPLEHTHSDEERQLSPSPQATAPAKEETTPATHASTRAPASDSQMQQSHHTCSSDQMATGLPSSLYSYSMGRDTIATEWHAADPHQSSPYGIGDRVGSPVGRSQPGSFSRDQVRAVSGSPPQFNGSSPPLTVMLNGETEPELWVFVPDAESPCPMSPHVLSRSVDPSADGDGQFLPAVLNSSSRSPISCTSSGIQHLQGGSQNNSGTATESNQGSPSQLPFSARSPSSQRTDEALWSTPHSSRLSVMTPQSMDAYLHLSPYSSSFYPPPSSQRGNNSSGTMPPLPPSTAAAAAAAAAAPGSSTSEINKSFSSLGMVTSPRHPAFSMGYPYAKVVDHPVGSMAFYPGAAGQETDADSMRFNELPVAYGKGGGLIDLRANPPASNAQMIPHTLPGVAYNLNAERGKSASSAVPTPRGAPLVHYVNPGSHPGEHHQQQPPQQQPISVFTAPERVRVKRGTMSTAGYDNLLGSSSAAENPLPSFSSYNPQSVHAVKRWNEERSAPSAPYAPVVANPSKTSESILRSGSPNSAFYHNNSGNFQWSTKLNRTKQKKRRSSKQNGISTQRQTDRHRGKVPSHSHGVGISKKERATLPWVSTLSHGSRASSRSASVHSFSSGHPTGQPRGQHHSSHGSQTPSPPSRVPRHHRRRRQHQPTRPTALPNPASASSSSLSQTITSFSTLSSEPTPAPPPVVGEDTGLEESAKGSGSVALPHHRRYAKHHHSPSAAGCQECDLPLQRASTVGPNGQQDFFAKDTAVDRRSIERESSREQSVREVEGAGFDSPSDVEEKEEEFYHHYRPHHHRHPHRHHDHQQHRRGSHPSLGHQTEDEERREDLETNKHDGSFHQANSISVPPFQASFQPFFPSPSCSSMSSTYTSSSSSWTDVDSSSSYSGSERLSGGERGCSPANSVSTSAFSGGAASTASFQSSSHTTSPGGILSSTTKWRHQLGAARKNSLPRRSEQRRQNLLSSAASPAPHFADRLVEVDHDAHAHPISRVANWTAQDQWKASKKRQLQRQENVQVFGIPSIGEGRMSGERGGHSSTSLSKAKRERFGEPSSGQQQQPHPSLPECCAIDPYYEYCYPNSPPSFRDQLMPTGKEDDPGKRGKEYSAADRGEGDFLTPWSSGNHANGSAGGPHLRSNSRRVQESAFISSRRTSGGNTPDLLSLVPSSSAATPSAQSRNRSASFDSFSSADAGHLEDSLPQQEGQDQEDSDRRYCTHGISNVSPPPSARESERRSAAAATTAASTGSKKRSNIFSASWTALACGIGNVFTSVSSSNPTPRSPVMDASSSSSTPKKECHVYEMREEALVSSVTAETAERTAEMRGPSRNVVEDEEQPKSMRCNSESGPRRLRGSPSLSAEQKAFPSSMAQAEAQENANGPPHLDEDDSAIPPFTNTFSQTSSSTPEQRTTPFPTPRNVSPSCGPSTAFPPPPIEPLEISKPVLQGGLKPKNHVQKFIQKQQMQPKLSPRSVAQSPGLLPNGVASTAGVTNAFSSNNASVPSLVDELNTVPHGLPPIVPTTTPSATGSSSSPKLFATTTTTSDPNARPFYTSSHVRGTTSSSQSNRHRPSPLLPPLPLEGSEVGTAAAPGRATPFSSTGYERDTPPQRAPPHRAPYFEGAEGVELDDEEDDDAVQDPYRHGGGHYSSSPHHADFYRPQASEGGGGFTTTYTTNRRSNEVSTNDYFQNFSFTDNNFNW